MNLYRRLLFLILFIATVTAGCQRTQDVTPTPTTTGNPRPLTIGRDVYTIDFAELATDPATYEGYHLQLTGQYKPLPTLVCAQDPYPGPVAWGLVSDGYLAYASGYAHLRSLIPTGLTMTVQGQWRYWAGPVGCGKQAAHQEFWYLAVTDIVAPSPITRVTLTPPGADGEQPTAAATEVAIVTTPADIPPETAVPPTADLPTIPAAATLPITLTLSPTTEGVETGVGTPASTSVGTPVDTGGGTAVATPTIPAPTPTITSGGVITVTGTPDLNATPTKEGDGEEPPPPPSDGTNTPGPSPTPTSTPMVINMGEIEDKFLAVERLGSNEAHSWEVNISANDVLTAYAVAVQEDIVLTLLDASGKVIITENSALPGMVETLVQSITNAGSYRLHVSASSGAATDYALMLRFNSSYAFVIKGVLRYGDSKTASMPADSDEFWHFAGTAGDNVTITITPGAGQDAFFKLYDTNAVDMDYFIDEGDVGEAETFSFTLPVTGLYSIHVGEFNYGAMGYTIVLVKN